MNSVERSDIKVSAYTCGTAGKNSAIDFVCSFLACFEKEFEKAILEIREQEFEKKRKKLDNSRLFCVASRRKFGFKLRELRKKAKLTRDEAAKLANINSPTMITYYEIGRSFPPEEYVEKLGKLAGLSREEIEKLQQELKCLRIMRFQPTAGRQRQKGEEIGS